ncbi:NAD(P)H-hydrate dehydratase [Mesorhizobium sp. CAU 1741]|uniref:NAD(P)H-hydrate dehydratase n=1 Tax=Mesorhizobium sp. CAU 1741 TaxID=3140366 RepID=UPI00325B3350
MQRAYDWGTPIELLTPEEMARADLLAIGGVDGGGYRLMCNAGLAVGREPVTRYPQATAFDVLCGPGNNGGDGYVVARLLHEWGSLVRVWTDGAPRAATDAALAAADCPVTVAPLADFVPSPGAVVVDALYGAGLTRALDGAALQAARACNAAGCTVVSVDLPSGVSGASGVSLGDAFAALLTVTFFRRKPGHMLEPGRRLCGETIVADIGIEGGVLDVVKPLAFVNSPLSWRHSFPRPDPDQHKYSRGHVAVFSGGMISTGAARLAAMAAARIGAGAVTIYSPAAAIATNAAHLTSIMLRKIDDASELRAALAARAPDAFVLGPGFGLGRPVRETVLSLLRGTQKGVLVLDADGLSAFRDEPEGLFEDARRSRMGLVLTPHEGEFARLFPDLACSDTLSKLDKAREAANRAGSVVVYKGPDTVIAAPDGRAAINANGSPYLATAGSGDVLAGMIAGLCAQNMPAFDAACVAVWIHAEAALRFGPGLIAEDLPGMLPPLLGELLAD